MHILSSLIFVFPTSLLKTLFFFFFFNDTATTEIYTLSLHDALPISFAEEWSLTNISPKALTSDEFAFSWAKRPDRKSTRLNSSHTVISYAVFCLKKKKNCHTKSSHTAPSRNMHKQTTPTRRERRTTA